MSNLIIFCLKKKNYFIFIKHNQVSVVVNSLGPCQPPPNDDLSQQDEKYIFKDWVKLENCRVENSIGSGQGGTTKGRQNSFYLVVDVNRRAYTILTKDSDSKERWMKHISDAM